MIYNLRYLLLMRVFVFFFVFLQFKKKDEITQVCVRLFYSLHIHTFNNIDEKSLKGTAKICWDTFFLM